MESRPRQNAPPSQSTGPIQDTRPSQTDIEAHPSSRIGTAPPRTRAWSAGGLEAEGFPVHTGAVREIVSDLLETRLALQGNRVDDVMKKLAGWAAIIAVPSAIIGFHGQNVLFPGAADRSGFITSAGLSIISCVALFIFFKRRDWL